MPTPNPRDYGQSRFGGQGPGDKPSERCRIDRNSSAAKALVQKQLYEQRPEGMTHNQRRCCKRSDKTGVMRDDCFDGQASKSRGRMHPKRLRVAREIWPLQRMDGVTGERKGGLEIIPACRGHPGAVDEYD